MAAASNGSNERDEEKDIVPFDDITKNTAPAVPAEEPNDFPDGGIRAWSVVLGTFLVQFCTVGYVNAYGVFNDYYVREYLSHYSSSTISWIGSIQLFIALSGGLIAGRGFDHGYFYHLIIGGGIVLVVCLFTLSLAQPEHFYQFFLAHGMGVGIATGMAHVPSMAVVSHYFRRRRAFAMGIASTGSALGGALHPIMLNKLFYGRAGFHGGVRASAGMCLALYAIGLCLLRPRLPPKKTSINFFKELKNFAKDPSYVFMVIGTTLTYAGLYFPIYFIQLNAIKNGINANLAFYTIAILNGTNAFGRFLPNMIVHRAGILNVIIICEFIASLLVFCTLGVKTAPGTIVFTIFYGFFSGAFLGLLAPMIASSATNQAEIGARMGICLAFTGIGGLIGNPIAGALLSSDFIWWKPIIFAGICISAGGLCICVTRFLVARVKGTQWL